MKTESLALLGICLWWGILLGCGGCIQERRSPKRKEVGLQESRAPPKLTGGWEDWHKSKTNPPNLMPKSRNKALRERMKKEIEKAAAKKFEEYLKNKGM